MKVPDDIILPKSSDSKPQSAFAIRLQHSLHRLKQSERMWYTHLSDYLIRKRYKNDELCPCVFIMKTSFRFTIVAVYVDDMNIIDNLKKIDETVTHLKSEFEMKGLGKTRFCLGLKLEHRETGILIHQSAYV